jgi:hypothetical protein
MNSDNDTFFRGSFYHENASKHYRHWYVQGQADFRAGNPPPEEILGNESAEEAWNMGWQSDAAAESMHKPFSFLGTHSVVPSGRDDMHGYSEINYSNNEDF